MINSIWNWTVDKKLLVAQSEKKNTTNQPNQFRLFGGIFIYFRQSDLNSFIKLRVTSVEVEFNSIFNNFIFLDKYFIIKFSDIDERLGIECISCFTFNKPLNVNTI